MVRDRGMYICTAENPAGIAQASAIVEVERREAPGVVLYPQATQTVVQGGSALFQCRVTAGIPTPRAKWTRVGGGSMPNNVEELDGGVIRLVSKSRKKVLKTGEKVLKVSKKVHNVKIRFSFLNLIDILN